jgi:hypothetical protein
MLFDYLDYKNKIPLDKCIIEFPKLNPLSNNYKKFWNEVVKRKVIEGHWVEHEGLHKWIPGPIFMYTNVWSIELAKKGSKSKSKIIGRPRLRDIEWIKGFVHAVARGFSGFENDEEYTCNRLVLAEDFDELMEYTDDIIKESIYKPNGELKTYVPALEYLYKYFDRNMGKAMYLNDAKNVVDIECRNIGKSFISGCFAGHNFLTDGAMDYDEMLAIKSAGSKFNTSTLIGAIDSKYSTGLIQKLKLGLKELPGRTKVGKRNYPPPLSKKTSGSWKSGEQIVALYKKKVGGGWEVKGSGSMILHRSFKANEHAANGTRYSFGIIDEVGFMDNLEASLGQLHECTTADGRKYGTIWMTGTGGDMEGGSTEAVMRVFYSPASYDCLEFDDTFENSGKKIGFFVPAYMALDEFRDEFGNVNRDAALRKLIKERDIAKKAKSKAPLNDLLQMKPLLPSEAFLVSGGNIFDRPELSEHIKFLETDSDGYIKGRVGYLTQTPEKVVEFRDDFTDKLKPCEYPIQEKDDKTGAVVIWEEPIPDPPYGYYVATLDPYAQDEAPNSVSLGSMGIFKRAMVGGSTVDMLVAEYTARPETMDEFFDNCKKLMLLYNAHCLYENNYNHYKTYLQNRNLLHMLFKTPTALKNNKVDAIANTYGLRMTDAGGNGLKSELELYTRDWLFADAGDGKMNLHHIYSIPLLKELKGYNDVGNYDRAIMLFLFVAQRIQMAKIISARKESSKKKWWNEHKFNGV